MFLFSPLYRTFDSVLCAELIRVLLCLLVAILRFPATNLEGRQNWIGKDHYLIESQFFGSILICEIGEIRKLVKLSYLIGLRKSHPLIANSLCCLNFK